MLNNDNSDRSQIQDYAKKHFGLDELAKDWENMIYNLLEEKKTNPIIPYQPTIPYRCPEEHGYYEGDTRYV